MASSETDLMTRTLTQLAESPTYFLSTVFLLVVLYVMIFSLYQAKRRRRIRQSPHPPGPVCKDKKLGHFAEMAKAGSLHEYLVQLHQEYGSVVSFNFGELPVVSLGSPRVLSAVARVFDRPVPLFAGFMPMITEHSIQYANGDEGRARHRLITSLFRDSSIEGYFDSLVEVSLRGIAEMRVAKGEAIEIYPLILKMAVEGISTTLFSQSTKKEVDTLLENYTFCWDEMEQRLIAGKVPDEGAEKEFQRRLGDTFKMIKEKIADCRQNHPLALLLRLIATHEKNDDETALHGETLTLMVGGFHTTCTLMIWALYLLTENPECQEKLRKEIKTVIGDREITFHDVEKMEYTQKVIKESLRNKCVAPWGARVANKDIKVGGYVIPAETPVITALGVTQQSDEVWPDAQKFDPERFSEENLSKLQREFGNYYFAPFGGFGGRLCPGYRHTFHEATIFLTHILKNFRLEFGSEEDATPGLVYGLVTKPKKSIHLKFIPLSSEA